MTYFFIIWFTACLILFFLGAYFNNKTKKIALEIEKMEKYNNDKNRELIENIINAIAQIVLNTSKELVISSRQKRVDE